MNQRGKAINSAHTDPRSEAVLWVAVASPITYGILKDGFKFSKMTSVIGACVVGSAIWAEIPWFISKYYQKLAGIAGSDWFFDNTNHIGTLEKQ